MTSEGLGEMFEGDYAETCAGKFPLMSMGGRTEGLACVDLVAWTPIGVSGFNLNFHRQCPCVTNVSMSAWPLSNSIKI